MRRSTYDESYLKPRVLLFVADNPAPTIEPMCTIGPSGPKANDEEYEKIYTSQHFYYLEGYNRDDFTDKSFQIHCMHYSDTI